MHIASMVQVNPLGRKLMENAWKKIALQAFIFMKIFCLLLVHNTENLCVKKWFTRHDASAFCFISFSFMFFGIELLHHFQIQAELHLLC